jgi:hypothetical protein
VTYSLIGDEETYVSLYECWRYGVDRTSLVARGTLDAMVAAKRLMEMPSGAPTEEAWS